MREIERERRRDSSSTESKGDRRRKNEHWFRMRQWHFIV